MDIAYISVDIETSGPSPAEYSLLAIGACTLDRAERFAVELRPAGTKYDPAAMAVSGLSAERLAAEGVPAPEAMRRFAAWIGAAAGDRHPVFCALNAPFDWMFVADYFHRFLGHNPFGHNALDLKALFMGATGFPWPEARYDAMAARYGLSGVLPHRALDDAMIQAEILTHILAELPVPKDHERSTAP